MGGRTLRPALLGELQGAYLKYNNYYNDRKTWPSSSTRHCLDHNLHRHPRHQNSLWYHQLINTVKRHVSLNVSQSAMMTMMPTDVTQVCSELTSNNLKLSVQSGTYIHTSW